MQSTYERKVAEQGIAATQLRVGSAKLRRRKISEAFRIAWGGDDLPKKLGRIANTSHRTAERWVTGEYEAPLAVQLALLAELNKLQ